MAKAKKLTKKELENLRECLETLKQNQAQFNQAARGLMRAEKEASAKYQSLEEIESTLNGVQSKLVEKYGNVNIDVSTGELVESDDTVADES